MPFDSRPSAFITGAATGIGESLVNKLAEEGWLVFAGYRSSPPQKASWHQRENVVAVHCDVTQLDQIKAAAQQIQEHTCGQLDLLINNAGYPGNSGVIEDANMEDYRKTFEVNFWGPMQVAQCFMPLLRKAQGKLINITSASVHLTIPMGSSYPVAKTALKALTNHQRLEMAPFQVQVCSLEPGGVESPMTTLGGDVAESQWAAIAEPLRTQYRKHFSDSASAISNSFELYSAEQFADTVFKKIVQPKRIKPHYLIGPKSGALPWLHRLLPAQWVLNIWAKMFAAKK